MPLMGFRGRLNRLSIALTAEQRWMKGEKMMSEIIVEFPSPLTDKEKKMIYGYKGEVVRCKDCKKYIPCQKLPIGTSKWCDLFDRATCEMNYCGWGERREDD